MIRPSGGHAVALHSSMENVYGVKPHEVRLTPPMWRVLLPLSIVCFVVVTFLSVVCESVVVTMYVLQHNNLLSLYAKDE